MNKLKAALFAAIMVFSIAFVSGSLSSDQSFSAAAQQTTVRRRNRGIASRTYRGGRYVVRKTWDGTKYVSKKVWVGTKYVGKKSYQAGKYAGKKTWKTGRKVVSRTKKIIN
ncbi:MAG: hypothetical protein LC734_03245 [Acidobacteria bacterium]|nr:hypothetical protein [Acidobacteriota bacterium]